MLNRLSISNYNRISHFKLLITTRIQSAAHTKASEDLKYSTDYVCGILWYFYGSLTVSVINYLSEKGHLQHSAKLQHQYLVIIYYIISIIERKMRISSTQ